MLRKRHQYRILSTAFVFALVGVAFFGAYSGMRSWSGPIPATEPKPNARSAQHESAFDEIWQKTLDPLTLVTAFLTLATLWMARSVSRQVTLARDEFNVTHRPEMFVHTCEVAFDIHDEGECIGAQFVIVNKGTAPAIIEKIEGKVFLTDALRPGAYLDDLGVAGKELASGERYEAAIFGGPLESAVVTHFNKAPGDPTLWCIGRITYADKGGRRRETGFCRSYDIAGKRWIRQPESDYEYAY